MGERPSRSRLAASLTRLFGGASPAEQKQVGFSSAAGGMFMPLDMTGPGVWVERDYRKLSSEAYMKNAIGFRCMKTIASAAAGVGIHLMRRTDPKSPKMERVTDHPAVRLLDRPSPLMSRTAFLEQVYSYLRLAGNAYIEATEVRGDPRELWCLRPDRVKIVPGKSGMPLRYEYRHQEHNVSRTFPVSQVTGMSKVLHLKEFHPLDDSYGMSRGQPAAMGTDRHNIASVHNQALLYNGARPSGALVFKPIKTLDGDMVSAPKEVLKAAESELARRHQGPGNAGKPMVFGGDVDWKSLGITPRDMDFYENRRDAALDICTAWGVPSILVITENATYNNIKEAKLELYEEVVIPLVESFLSELNHWLLPKFGEDRDLLFKADLDSVIALEPRREARRQSITGLLSTGLININEARQELGYGTTGDSQDAIATAVDGEILRGLVEASEVVGAEPLRRYMIATGLIEEGTSLETLLGQALQSEEDSDDGGTDPDA